MPERVLIVAPNWLGDAVMALPAIADVRRALPGARLAIAARRSVADLFRLAAGIDEVVTLRADGRWWRRRAFAQDVAALAAMRADTALLLPNSFNAAWLVKRAGVGERWGYAADVRSRLLTRAVPRPRVACHQGEYYQQLVAALGQRVDLGVDVGDGHVAHVAAAVVGSRERRTSFDRAVGLDAEAGVARAAAGPVSLLDVGSAPSMFVRAEVADVVSRLHQHAQLHAVLGADAINREHQEIIVTQRFPDMDQAGKPEPLKKPIAFKAEWELRFGPGNRFRVFYKPEGEESGLLGLPIAASPIVSSAAVSLPPSGRRIGPSVVAQSSA